MRYKLLSPLIAVAVVFGAFAFGLVLLAFPCYAQTVPAADTGA